MRVNLKAGFYDRMHLLIENNLSPLIAKILHPYLLQELQGQAVHLSEKYSRTITDAELFRNLDNDEYQWTILSIDRFSNSGEKHALRQTQLKYINPNRTFSRQSLHIQVARIFLNMDHWQDCINGPNYWFKCNANGKLTVIPR